MDPKLDESDIYSSDESESEELPPLEESDDEDFEPDLEDDRFLQDFVHDLEHLSEEEPEISREKITANEISGRRIYEKDGYKWICSFTNNCGSKKYGEKWKNLDKIEIRGVKNFGQGTTMQSDEITTTADNDNIEQCNNNEEQEKRAILRQRFLKLAKFLNENPHQADIHLHTGLNMRADVLACSPDGQNFMVENFETPMARLNHAILRTSDIISMKLNLESSSSTDSKYEKMK